MDITTGLMLAYEMAMYHSTDPRTQNGAVLLTESGRVLKDSNHFPEGVRETEERWGKDKLKYVEHAERNVIFLAARLGVATDKAVMYVPWFACCDCARAIIQAGIKTVYGHDADVHHTRPDWKPSIDIADQMLREANVNFFRIRHNFGITIKFDGKLVDV
jgi:dCMP deaminase